MGSTVNQAEESCTVCGQRKGPFSDFESVYSAGHGLPRKEEVSWHFAYFWCKNHHS